MGLQLAFLTSTALILKLLATVINPRPHWVAYCLFEYLQILKDGPLKDFPNYLSSLEVFMRPMEPKFRHANSLQAIFAASEAQIEDSHLVTLAYRSL